MVRTFSAFIAAAVLIDAAFTQAQEDYPVHPDSVRKPGVAEGEIEGPFTWRSEIFPGTERDYWGYVPAGYDASSPACVLVVQDGLNRANDWKLTVVMDNLIHEGAMPVTIGIFINPGIVPASHSHAQPRFNRSFEYDSLGDRYARFLLEEILPEIEKTYNLSHDPNDRAIAGASSGGICAFTAAWERPDQFRRVLSTIGTFVGLRGGNDYPVLVRKTEPKPIRVFLQDGQNDLNLYAGSWWVANQDMLAALQFSGYDVQHVWGDGGHNGRHAAAIMPDALRWLWRDYPKPIQAGRAVERRIDILVDGEEWEVVSQGHRFTEGLAINDQGEVFFTDIPSRHIHKIDRDGTVGVVVEESGGVNGLMFGPDGYLYACQNGNRRIARYDSQFRVETVLEDAPCNDLITLYQGGGYYTDPENGKVWHVDADGNRTLADAGIERPNGVIASADQTQLFVNDTRGRWIYAFQIQPNGSLSHKQRFGHLHRPDDTGQTGADGMTVDTEGRLYVATNLGLQILDQLGRVHFIMSKPQDAWLSNVVFGGAELDTLYVTCGDKVFRRKVNAKGVVSWRPPVNPPKPRL